MLSREPEREFQSMSSLDSIDPDIQLSKILECKVCNQKYLDPIILPCFNTVCSQHVADVKEMKKFNCVLCSQMHLMPPNRFPVNKEILQLLDICVNVSKYNTRKLVCNQHWATFDTKQKMKQRFQNLSVTVQLCDSFANASHEYIDDHFKKIEHEVKLNKNHLIDFIEQHYMGILNKLNENRQKCCDAASLKSIHFKQLINSSKIKNDKWKEEFKKEGYNIDPYWKCIGYIQLFEINKLNFFLDKYKKKLLRNSDFEFKLNLNELKLGELIGKKSELKENVKTASTIRLVIENFKAFINAYDYKESVDYVEMRSVAWKIQAEIERSEKYELGLGFYVRVETDDQETLKLKPIKAEVKLSIIPCKPCSTHLSLSGTFKGKFDQTKIGYGFKMFLTLRQIMDPCNGIYDSAYDRITLEANIKLMDEKTSETNEKA